MHELTYRDYINYLQSKIYFIQEESLSPDEMRYFSLIKKQLSDSPNLPSYILDASLLSSIEYDEETTLIITEMKKAISIHGRLINYYNFSKLKIKELILSFSFLFRSPVFAGATISLMFLSIILLLLSLSTSTKNGEIIGAAGLDNASGVGFAAIGLILLIIVCILIVVCILIIVNFIGSKKK